MNSDNVNCEATQVKLDGETELAAAVMDAATHAGLGAERRAAAARADQEARHAQELAAAQVRS